MEIEGRSVKKFIKIAFLLITSAVFVTCGVAINIEKRRKLDVDAFALETAFYISAYINEHNECPGQPLNWEQAYENDRDLLEIKKRYFRIVYQCDSDLRAYISVYYSFDSESEAYIQPNSQVKWIYGHFTSKKEVAVKSKEEILSILKGID